jgi:hypothetical protein
MFFMFFHYRETWLVFHVWTMMVLIVILEMASVRYGAIMKVSVLLSKRKIFICYHFVKIWIPYLMWMRTYPHLQMRIENESELKMHRQNYGTAV